MQIVLLPKTYGVSDWAALFSALAEKYPNSWLSAKNIDVLRIKEIRYILTVEDHAISLKDRKFLNSIGRPPLSPQGSGVSDEVYNEMRASKWLIDGWYELEDHK